MFRMLAGGFTLALMALVPGSNSTFADDKDVTTWVRDLEGLELLFKVGKDTGTFVVTAGDNGATVKGKLTPSKDKKGVMVFEVTDVEEKGNFPMKPKKGDKLTFKWAEKGDKATLSDLEGDIHDDAKPVVAGDYKKKK